MMTHVLLVKTPLPTGHTYTNPQEYEKRGWCFAEFSCARKAGIIVLKDTTPGEEEDLLLATATSAAAGDNPDEEEPEPPAPFEFTG